MVDHLIQTDVLQPLENLLVLGEEGEKTFGKRHFFELYSVFETAPMMTVKTVEGQLVGTLDTSFVRLKESTEFVFLLAGRSWRAVEVDLDQGILFAALISGGEAPKWHGAGGFLGREIAEEMRSILLSEELPRFVDAPGQNQLKLLREEYHGILAHDRCPLVRQGDNLRLHTFAGGRINATIGALLELSGLVSVKGFGDLDIDLKRPDGGVVDAKTVQAILQGPCNAGERLTEADKAGLVTEKSRGKLTKFQPYLPPDLEGAFLYERLFDVAGAAELARQAKFSTVSQEHAKG
jgi:ATP-dependent Lhr-like helicase